MNKKLQIVIGIVILVIAVSVFYYLTKGKKELGGKEQLNSVDLDNCLSEVHVKATEKAQTLMDNATGPNLEYLNEELDDISEREDAEINNCYKQYPIR